MGMNTCPLLTACQELATKPGTFVCQPGAQGNGGGGGTFSSGGGGGGGTSHNGGGAGGGTGDSGCGCGSAPGGWLLLALFGLLKRRRSP
jgi:MYXO-CTERM domain-containing protein